jgi:hypothetical protein
MKKKARYWKGDLPAAERQKNVQVMVPETGIEPVRPLSGKRRILSASLEFGITPL